MPRFLNRLRRLFFRGCEFGPYLNPGPFVPRPPHVRFLEHVTEAQVQVRGRCSRCGGLGMLGEGKRVATCASCAGDGQLQRWVSIEDLSDMITTTDIRRALS